MNKTSERMLQETSGLPVGVALSVSENTLRALLKDRREHWPHATREIEALDLALHACYGERLELAKNADQGDSKAAREMGGS